MPATPSTADMGRRHEEDVAKRLGAYRVKASGATVHDKADLAHHHDDPFAFRADGKSTKGASITVTLAMIQKLREQAGGERPLLPLRWYGNAVLTQVLEDWVALTLDDFEELLASAVQTAEYATRCAQVLHERDEARDERDRMKEELDLLREEMGPLRTRLAQAEEWKASIAVGGGGGQGFEGPAIPGYIPRLPWTIIHAVSTTGQGLRHVGLHYDDKGHQSTIEISTVRVERSLHASNRPRLIVNDARVTDGALYVNGTLRTLVCRTNREIEVG